MECINHSGIAAAGTCQMCGKGLCVACVERFDPPLCSSCLIKNNDDVAQRFYMELGVTAVVFIGVVMFSLHMQPDRIAKSVAMGALFTGIYWGWQFMSRLPLPRFFLTGAGALAYLLLKLVISFYAGIVVGPWQIYRRIKELKEITSLKKEIMTEKGA